MINIKISDEFRNICPDFRGIAIYAFVKNVQYNQSLWNKMNVTAQGYKDSHTIENIKTNAVIAKTREAYKKFGKDPNRYRPSAEALCRRVVKGIPFYQINTLVDIINLVSVETGYSIGGFDADKIMGNLLTLGIGQKDEPYEAIGRGMLNIEGMPVYRDAIGGIGTPTSDHERTKIDLNTIHLLLLINGYSGHQGLTETAAYMQSLLKEFAQSTGENVFYF